MSVFNGWVESCVVPIEKAFVFPLVLDVPRLCFLVQQFFEGYVFCTRHSIGLFLQ